MKKRMLNMAMIAIISTAFIAGCTEIEPAEFIETAAVGIPGEPDPEPPPPPPPYDPITDPANIALREWKATPGLPQTFVWFDNWAGGTAGQYSLSGLPDSVTIASNWGQPKWGLTELQKTDMEYVQKVKGTKVVVTLFSAKVGDDVDADPIYNVGNSTDVAVIGPAIKKYAEAIYDKVVAEGYDGYDWDYEPQGGGSSANYLWTVQAQRRLFVSELGYWFGKSASTRTDRGDRKPVEQELLFLIDGEIGTRGRMDKNWESYNVDYFVLQAYGSASTASINTRVNGVLDDMSDWISAGTITKAEVVRRTILTENFESYSGNGGGVLVQSKYIHKPTSGTHVGVDQQIGGFGIYRVGFDYRSARTFQGSSEYGFLREGIYNIYSIYRSRQ
ncbi:MAG: glycoside hydrolase family 18 [Prevotellaceae bacterium]|jgi:hypothetical protein|nr:glycoside hydrolase family 18 [Prevotellaceae bacterium]